MELELTGESLRLTAECTYGIVTGNWARSERGGDSRLYVADSLHSNNTPTPRITQNVTMLLGIE